MPNGNPVSQRAYIYARHNKCYGTDPSNLMARMKQLEISRPPFLRRHLTVSSIDVLLSDHSALMTGTQ